ncbi:hypothetical protein JR316_0006380 [Psilocybe cubensis]|uniref:Uncharacterized protein n=1 Tax=Psilocybe cubensis TaxID=181762 RepID=A0ACB8H3S3_PSICU|nr:hypothetical protein JR316_0006380 [Psilocybe cubensis]KAH9481850.1 hypothetical protein JR316_0006380 [Psilocybe cubensis]
MSTRQRIPAFLKRLISGQPFDDVSDLIRTIDMCIATIRLVEKTPKLADRKISEFKRLQGFIIANTDKLFTKVKPHEVQTYTEVYNSLLQDYSNKTITNKQVIINTIARLWFGPGKLIVSDSGENSTPIYVADQQSSDQQSSDNEELSTDSGVMSSPVDEAAQDEVGELIDSALASKGTWEDADLIMRKSLELARKFADGRRYRIVTPIPSSAFLDSVFQALGMLHPLPFHTSEVNPHKKAT